MSAAPVSLRPNVVVNWGEERRAKHQIRDARLSGR